MLWIKRNLFLTLGGLVAALLLGAGIVYFLGAKSKNDKLEEDIAQTTNTLNTLYNAPVFPGATNIDTARRETEKLRAAVAQMQKLFTPVPAEKVTGLAFRSYRDNTLAELHHLADQARTTLPSKTYAFSFQAQKDKVDFKEGTFPAIPQQMAEVKAMCKILFDAHVDPLLNLRRSRVSKDDEESSAATDYHSLKIETNSAMDTVTSPYEVTFNCLSSDLAATLQGFMGSPHGFVVKAFQVEPAAEPAAPALPGTNPRAPGTPTTSTQTPAPPPPRPLRPSPAGAPGAAVGQVPPPPPPALAATVPLKTVSSDKPIILLKERRLKVTLLVYVIKTLK